MNESRATPTSRREFLSLSGGAIAVGTVNLSTTPAQATESHQQEVSTSGYRSTKHIQQFYELARF